MRIVISGGWGYRNLGDDAILDSTIQLLLEKYPASTIDVLTYDVDDSQIHKQERVSLHRSAHACMDFNVCEYRYPLVNKDYPLAKKIYYKLFDKVVESKFWFNLLEKRAAFSSVEAIIKGADLFIMSGGGYFNEKWLSKTRSHILELEIAKKHNVPFYILGPTIGSFSEEMVASIKPVFASAMKIAVRDDSSFAEVSQYKSDISLIPDVALSTWLPNVKQVGEKVIGIIFTNSSSLLQTNLVLALASFITANPEWRIKLFISRRWKYDFANAMQLQAKLFAKGLDAEIVFPASFHTLEEGLATCQMVISENLHGLILAARNLVPVIAINDYPAGSPNYKKFIAFLKQSNSESYFINLEKSEECICQLISEFYNARAGKVLELESLRTDVRQQNIAFI